MVNEYTKEEKQGLALLFIFLFIVLIFVVFYTGFNPFRDCDTFTNSSLLRDCWMPISIHREKNLPNALNLSF